MATVSGLKLKLDGLMGKYAPIGRTVYKRVYTRGSVDDLIGTPSSSAYTDTTFSPQPVSQRFGSRLEAVLAQLGVVPADDYNFLFSASAIGLSDLQNKNLQIVLKSGSSVEVCRVVNYDSVGFAGEDAAYLVRLRSIAR